MFALTVSLSPCLPASLSRYCHAASCLFLSSACFAPSHYLQGQALPLHAPPPQPYLLHLPHHPTPDRLYLPAHTLQRQEQAGPAVQASPQRLVAQVARPVGPLRLLQVWVQEAAEEQDQAEEEEAQL